MSTKKEGKLLNQALSGTLSKECQHQLSEKWKGFNTSGVQEDVIKATSLVISPNKNTTPELKLRFQWNSLDHIKLSDICLAFNLKIYKRGQSERVPTAFNLTAGHANTTLMRKFCLREDFIFCLIKG